MADLNQEVAYIAPGPRTFTCSEAITPSGCVVQLDADGRVSIADAADDFLLGIAAHTSDAAGDKVSVIPLSGYQRARAGASINEGSWLTVESGGRVIATTTDTNECIGIAAEAAADGDLVLVACGRCRYAG